ncbi:MAG: histidine kinase [Acidobacteriota bacterium]
MMAMMNDPPMAVGPTKTSFLEDMGRMRGGLPKLVMVLAINTTIAVFIALIVMMIAPDLPWKVVALGFLQCLVYSNSIGFLVAYSLGGLYSWLTSLPTLAGVMLLNLLLIVSGILGDQLGRAISNLFLPMQLLPEWMRKENRLIDYLVSAAICILVGNLVYFYLNLRARWEQSKERLRQQELFQERLWKLKAEAELSALQARIHPHFLFNTLNSIASLVRENPELAESIIEKLAGLFRYSLASSRSPSVALENELAFVKSYLEIEKIRLGRRLQFAVTADDLSTKVRIPGLLLQPIVENAVQHGIAPKETGGTVNVHAGIEAERCVITVMDDGSGFGGTDPPDGYALENIRERLMAAFGAGAQLKVDRTPDGWTRVSMNLPSRVEDGE